MKTFNEWQKEVTVNENPEIFMDKISELCGHLENTLATFTGERFEGFLNIVGQVKNLKRELINIQNGTTSPNFITSESKKDEVTLKKEDRNKDGHIKKRILTFIEEKKQGANEKQKDVDYKADKSTGVRSMDSDLSKDHKKYAKKLGTVDPFKIVKKKTSGKK